MARAEIEPGRPARPAGRRRAGGPRIGPVAALRERWLTLRDRLLADRGFHRFAAASPLLRPFARRRAAALFDLVAGFVYSQTLAACVRLRLFDALADGPASAAELAPRLGLTEDAAERLLEAAAALELTTRRAGGRYGLGELGAALRGAPGVPEMVAHHALLYADMADPVALLRGEAAARPAEDAGEGGGPTLAGYWGYVDRGGAAGLDADAVGAYSALMAASQPLVAEETLAAYPVRRHRRILDVGGGDGAFLRAAAAAAPKLELALFDLPAVAARAEARLEAAGLGARARVYGGSFFDDPLPEGADLLTLVRVIYDHDDAHAMAILRRARAATPPDGALLVSEPMAAPAGSESGADAYFAFYLLAMGGGRPRTQARLIEMLRAAGFSRARALRTRRPLLTRAVLARP